MCSLAVDGLPVMLVKHGLSMFVYVCLYYPKLRFCGVDVAWQDSSWSMSGSIKLPAKQIGNALLDCLKLPRMWFPTCSHPFCFLSSRISGHTQSLGWIEAIGFQTHLCLTCRDSEEIGQVSPSWSRCRAPKLVVKLQAPPYNMELSWNGGSSRYHPFWYGMFHIINQPFWGSPMAMETPI